jgi:hypothetical protein
MADIDLSVILSGSSSLTARAGVRFSGGLILQAFSGMIPRASVRYTSRLTLNGFSNLVSNPTVNLGVQSPIRYQPAPRLVNASKLVTDQVDLFRIDGKTRSQGVSIGDLNLKLFFNGSQIRWPLVSGTTVQDPQITAGQVYWTEFLTGFYTIRFFPTVVGLWRILLTYPAYDQAVSLSYDVSLPAFVPVSSGIRTSFVNK